MTVVTFEIKCVGVQCWTNMDPYEYEWNWNHVGAL